MTTQTRSARAEYVQAFRDERSARAIVQLLEQELEYRRGAHRKARAHLMAIRQSVAGRDELELARPTCSAPPAGWAGLVRELETGSAIRSRSSQTSPARRARRIQVNRRIRRIREERPTHVPGI